MTARTLLSLRTELAQRLGFSSSGSGAILQKDLFNSALRSGQEQLFYEFGDLLTHIVNDREPGATVKDQVLYDLPPNLDPLKPLTVSIQRTTGGIFFELQVGISVPEHNVLPVINQRWPSRWDLRNDSTVSSAVKTRLELWPTPDQAYNLKLEYNAGLGPFENDVDLSTIHPQLIMLHGIVTMKAHYNQPDFQLYASQLSSLLGRIKAVGLQAGGSTRRYFKRTMSFSLDPSTYWPIGSNVTDRVQNIISSSTLITPASGSSTFIETASS
jgi:hypothetical protein|tara:strand:- start:393 stop:1202 length:810 start_codon:yes stop_codon:yes gene_type:complete